MHIRYIYGNLRLKKSEQALIAFIELTAHVSYPRFLTISLASKANISEHVNAKIGTNAFLINKLNR